jgi:hypothetical protein
MVLYSCQNVVKRLGIFLKEIAYMKTLLLILVLLPAFAKAGPFTSTFDLEHDLMHIGAGCLVISATNYTLRLCEASNPPEQKLSPWVHFAIETGMDLAIQCLYQA